MVHWDLRCFLVMFATCLDCLVIFSFCLLLQGSQALSSFVDHFRDPELSRLATCLTLRCLGARADSTTSRYSRAFEKFRLWTAGYEEINALPSDCLSVATYLESLIQSNSSFSAIEVVSLAAVFSIVTQRSSPQTAAHIRTTFLSTTLTNHHVVYIFRELGAPK